MHRTAAVLIACVPLLLAAAARDGLFPRCYDPGAEQVPRIQQLLQCQALARRSYVSAYEKANQRMPSDARMDRFDAFQRGEVRDFTAAHPDKATIVGEEERPEPSKQEAQTLWEKLKDLCKSAKAELDSFIKKQGKEGGKAAEAAQTQAQESLEVLRKGLKSGGTDLEKLREDAMKDPGGALKKAVQKYNKQIDSNLSPEMKKYFKKPGESKGK